MGTGDDVHGTRPRLSVGIPIRNGEQALVRPLESCLAQDGIDLEIIVSDNASTDGTEQLCRRYAAQDARVRYHRLPDNIGLLANFRRVFSLSRGTYFRWLGAHDWLEPDYGRRCVEELEAHPTAALVTTGMRLMHDDGSWIAGGLQPGPRSDDPVERLRQLLRLLNQGYRAIDPVYSTIRRRALSDSGLIRAGGLDTDQVLAAELALLGPWLHIPDLLAGRQHPRFDPPRTLARRFGEPPLVTIGRQLRLSRSIHELLAETEYTQRQRRRGSRAITGFYLRRRAQFVSRAANRARTLAVSALSGRV